MVFFDEAIYNVFFLRCMLFKNKGGNGILIGLGSSGRTSYSKIASDLSGFRVNIYNGAKFKWMCLIRFYKETYKRSR